MHDDLVKRLRNRRICIQQSGSLDDFPLLAEAADAIEELSQAVDAIPHVCECCIGCEVESGGCDNAFVLSPKRARKYLNKPRWIPVTERLPDDGGFYIVYLRPLKGNTDLGFTLGDLSYATEMYFDKGQMLWVGENESYNAVLSVVNTETEYHITHWMPLPEPPEEG